MTAKFSLWPASGFSLWPASRFSRWPASGLQRHSLAASGLTGGLARGLPVLAACLALGCNSGASEIYDVCTLRFTALAPTAAAGDAVTAEGGPLSEAYDTAVVVGGIPALVTEVRRDDRDQLYPADTAIPGDPSQPDTACAACLDCRATTYSCDACAETCADCVERVTFVVPALDPGETSFVVANAYGNSGAVSLVISGADTGRTTASTPTDTGAPGSTGTTP